MTIEVGSGTAAEKVPAIFESNAPRVLLAVTNAAGVTFVKANETARGWANVVITSDVNEVMADPLAVRVKPVPDPNKVSVNVPDR
jgi:hypothetical protein